MPTDDYWIDTGRPDTYLKANLDLIDGSRPIILSSVGTNAHIASSASITRSVIGEGCTIGEGCVVIDSVLLPGAVLGDRVRLERSMVMGTVSDESSLLDCVIGAGVVVPAGAELKSTRIPDPEQKV
jgi:NDP-sugar pyrophosphorylase family protein